MGAFGTERWWQLNGSIEDMVDHRIAQRPEPLMRTFATGATRNTDTNKLDYDGFLSPYALEAYAKYMHKHRFQEDGSLRDSDNWQKGIPLAVFVKSLWRHFFDFWAITRGLVRVSPEDGHLIDVEEACCSIMFNVMGYLHEHLKERANKLPPQ